MLKVELLWVMQRRLSGGSRFNMPQLGLIMDSYSHSLWYRPASKT